MRPRSALVAVVALSSVASAPAYAAKRPVIPKICNVMTDQAGDGDWNQVSQVKSDNLDIVSADIATGPTELVAVLRLAKLDFSGDNWATLGYRYALGATAGGARYEFDYRRGGTGAVNSGASIAGTGVPYTVSTVGNTIVWKVKRAGIAPLARPGLVWTNFGANSQVLSSTADDAIGTDAKKYKDKQPSCVTAK